MVFISELLGVAFEPLTPKSAVTGCTLYTIDVYGQNAPDHFASGRGGEMLSKAARAWEWHELGFLPFEFVLLICMKIARRGARGVSGGRVAGVFRMVVPNT